MDCQYMHDDASMVVFDLYCSLLEESGYDHIPPEPRSFNELFDTYEFYSKVFNMLKRYGYVSEDISRRVNHVLEKVRARAWLEYDCVREEEETSKAVLEREYDSEEFEDNENDVESFEEQEVFNDGIDG